MPDDRHDPDRAAPVEASGEVTDPDDGERSTALPAPVERWRRRSATGAIMTGFAFGLREVFEPERKEPAIMLETSGDPPTDLPVEAEFDAISSRRSVVRIRPWLLERTGGTDPVDAATPTPPTTPADRTAAPPTIPTNRTPTDRTAADRTTTPTTPTNRTDRTPAPDADPAPDASTTGATAGGGAARAASERVARRRAGRPTRRGTRR